MSDRKLLSTAAVADLRSHWDEWNSGCHLDCQEFDDATSSLLLAAELLPKMAEALREVEGLARQYLGSDVLLEPARTQMKSAAEVLAQYDAVAP